MEPSTSDVPHSAATPRSTDGDDSTADVEDFPGEEETWDDWEGGSGDDDEDRTRSLFDPDTVLSSAQAAVDHDAKHHDFDLRQFVSQAKLDEYGIIQCVNFVRSEVAAGRDPRPALKASAASCRGSGERAAAAGATAEAPWRDERYLRPVLQDDPLLWHDFGGAEVVAGQASATGDTSSTSRDATGGAAAAASDVAGAAFAEVERLEAENAALRQALVDLRLALMPPELEEAAREFQDGASTSASQPSWRRPPQQSESAAAAAASTSYALSRGGKPADSDVRQVRHVDERYFESYSGLSIHYDMLSDKPRTEAYQKALESNPDLIRGKTVLDVGCGTGILSLFAARAGAARVTAVDGSKRIAEFATQIAKLNRLDAESGGPVSVVCGKLEELGGAVPPASVDVIVSEWMGYALLFETMLDTVLYARDHLLKPGGSLLPDRASIHIAGVNASATGLDFWKDVYGFNMAPLADVMLEGQLRKGIVHAVSDKDLVTAPVVVRELDLMTMRSEEQDFSAEFELRRRPANDGGATASDVPLACCAVALWFDVDFSARCCNSAPVKLSTSPAAPVTHWAQTMLLLPRPVLLAGPEYAAATPSYGPAFAQVITGRISMVRSLAKHRSLDISLEYKAALSDGTHVSETHLYYMNVTADE